MVTPNNFNKTQNVIIGPPQAIFCCASALPVITDDTYKIHNDPNRDFHNRIAHSFMAYVSRVQHQALLTALIQTHLQDVPEVEDAFPRELTSSDHSHEHNNLKLEAMARTHALNLRRDSNSSTSLGSAHFHNDWARCNDLPTRGIVHGVDSLGCGDEEDHNSGWSCLLPRGPDLALFNSTSTRDLGTRLADLLLSETFVLEDSDPSVARSDSTQSEQTTDQSPSPPSKVQPFHHVMTIPVMPHPLHPTEELLNNPLTPDTTYVVHLTSRHDYGPVYSHRYFACPTNLEDDWIELTLLQWFARGAAFDMKAEKWDIKCENDCRFFRMTLRPNLNMRVTN